VKDCNLHAIKLDQNVLLNWTLTKFPVQLAFVVMVTNPVLIKGKVVPVLN
jgi:hypothetical protein